MAVHFTLKRWWPDGKGGLMDLYLAIKSGSKTVEYRDFKEFWTIRLLNKRGREDLGHILYTAPDPYDFNIYFAGSRLKHQEATFTVGMVKYPKLRCKITGVTLDLKAKQYHIHITDPVEEQE